MGCPGFTKGPTMTRFNPQIPPRRKLKPIPAKIRTRIGLANTLKEAKDSKTEHDLKVEKVKKDSGFDDVAEDFAHKQQQDEDVEDSKPEEEAPA